MLQSVKGKSLFSSTAHSSDTCSLWEGVTRTHFFVLISILILIFLSPTIYQEVRGQGQLENSHPWSWEGSSTFFRPTSVVWMLVSSGSISSLMFSVFPSNKMSVLTLCPGWSPVLSWAFGPVVDKSRTYVSATQDWQDPNKLRQQHTWH